MDAIIAHVSDHWVEWLFAAALLLLTAAWRMVAARLKEEHDKNEAIGEGVQSLLRESIINNYNRYSERGYCPVYAKESLRKVYHSYHNLGGNDVATDLYNKVLDMPTDPKEETT